jgi:hypothetical protein
MTCVCGHPVPDHELFDDGDPVILQLAPCRSCDCADWDGPGAFPGRPPIYEAVVGLDVDGRVTVTNSQEATP